VITQLRLAWHLQRWELAFVAAACLGLSAAAFWQAADMRSMLTGCGTPAAAPACLLVYPFQDSHGFGVQLTQMAISFMPFVAGLVLGVPVVAREVELRTALVTWPLAGSRLRWLAWRGAPLLVVFVVLVGVLAVAADQLAHAYFPNSTLGFVQYDYRGLPLVMRSILMLVSGVALGALLGRVLPALLVGIGLSVVVAMGLNAALPHWVPSTELTAAESVQTDQIGSLNTDLQFRMPDGTTIDAQVAEEMIYAANRAGQSAQPDPSTLPHEVFFGIAASRYGEVLVRETAVLGVAVFGMGALAAVIVRRRRPE
jgi:hypothetical protein